MYSRELPTVDPDPESFLYQIGKWGAFDEALSSEADALVVAFPETLGDSYTEIIVNLSKLASAENALVVAGTSVSLEESETLDLG